jgi:hypothetical protein
MLSVTQGTQHLWTFCLHPHRLADGQDADVGECQLRVFVRSHQLVICKLDTSVD